MAIITKKYCFIYTCRLSPNSVLRKIHIVNEAIDYKSPIQIFDNDRYSLSIRIDQHKSLDELIYKFDCEETIDKYGEDRFEKEALDEIIKSIDCLQFAFIGLLNHNRARYISIKDIDRSWGNITQPFIEVFNYETGYKETPLAIKVCMSRSSNSLTISFDKISVPLEQICTVLKYANNELFARFLIIEKLSNDPVLHLITLYSLYEYICEGNEDFAALFNIEIDGKFKGVKRKNIPSELVKLTFIDKFKSARDFIAHGVLHSNPTLEALKQFLGSISGKKTLAFDRYNPSHINLINEVIDEAQTIIHNYLREELRIH